MTEVWDQSRLEQYITQGIEESLTLDYKAAGSLVKNDTKRAEVTKDVSAMANSAGGIIIYGIAEDPTNKHLPARIDPIDRNQISKEWLEQVISNIRPKLGGLVIYPVSISTAPTHVVYVVDIPQSYTAHQATDKRYYKRFNFESVAMEDYEIRDVMGRNQHAQIDIDFQILIRTEIESSRIDMPPLYDQLRVSKKAEPKKYTVYELKVKLWNIGKVYAQYIKAFIQMPCALVYDYEAMRREQPGKPSREFIPDDYRTYSRDNTVRDKIKGGGWMAAEYGPARHVPILPGISMNVDGFTLTEDFEAIDWGQCTIKWTTHADNAPPNFGEVAIKDIEIIDQRNMASE